MRRPIPARVQGLSCRARVGCGRSAAVGHQQAVVAVPQASGVFPAHGGGAAPKPHPRRRRGNSPCAVAQRVSPAM